MPIFHIKPYMTYMAEDMASMAVNSCMRLLLKLKGYGIQGRLLKWIENFLKDRKQRVQVDGESSEWADVTSGIPQGSVFRPTLSLIYINDLPDVVHSFVKLFADDAKLLYMLWLIQPMMQV